MEEKQEKILFKGCKKQKQSAQQALFEYYVDYMRSVCLRYVKQPADADDLLQDGFVKVFNSIDKFTWKGKGSFLGWVKRVMVNNAIDVYRKKTKENVVPIDSVGELQAEESSPQFDGIAIFSSDDFDNLQSSKLSQSELLQMIQELPEHYSVVFNLFVLEGYKHREIAEMLDISVKTSTTRMMRAKQILQTKVLEYCKQPDRKMCAV